MASLLLRLFVSVNAIAVLASLSSLAIAAEALKDHGHQWKFVCALIAALLFGTYSPAAGGERSVALGISKRDVARAAGRLMAWHDYVHIVRQ